MKDEYRILNSDLLKQLMAGEEQALVKIIDVYRTQLSYYAYYFLGNVDEANDVVQEVFIKLWMVKDNLNNNTSLEKYLITLTKNLCISELRKAQTRLRRAGNYAYGQPRFYNADELENAELGSRLNAALQSLTATQQKIFRSVYLEGKSHLEVMKEYDIKLPTVKVTIYTALKILRAKLHDIVK
ncbi:RNA polymerase sigma factor [Chitinophaga sp. S165]|uniref:RNA polymerase sigma factor n=1 Tax=Chitinophaga sp. S165 TaxID=2135462 RepID=UPI000D710E16|nr:sigma-70 family RNA polymerase sigma factor [Chitinophaga sp. S165]PWV55501.1 RNA polymerase sigma-70 factor (ECF subfamily) [Chitinophaga sp. S165]